MTAGREDVTGSIAMIRKLMPVIVLGFVAAAAGLTFSADPAPAVPLSEVVLVDLSGLQQAAADEPGEVLVSSGETAAEVEAN
jgi:hypothetical protein